MATTDANLLIEPSQELHFKGPFKDEVSTSNLSLTNPSSDKRFTFKVKTTAPKRYCVRPNQGIVEPGATVNVAVMLQPFEYDPAEKNKHKFMVQTMLLTQEGDVELEPLWRNAAPEQVMTSNKLRCVFDMPEEDPNDILSRPDPKDMKGATEELRRLREEMSGARTENLQLKEEGIRLRRQLATMASSNAQGAAADTAPVDGTLYYVMTVVALIIGVVVGKLVI